MDWMEKLLQVEGDFSPTDVKSLKLVFSGKPFQRAMREVVREADAMAKLLATSDLVTEEGRLKAIRTQGKIEGIRRAVDLLIELTETEQEENHDEQV